MNSRQSLAFYRAIPSDDRIKTLRRKETSGLGLGFLTRPLLGRSFPYPSVLGLERKIRFVLVMNSA